MHPTCKAMTDSPVLEPPQPKPKRHRVNLALAGTLLARGMGYDEIAKQVGAANGNSLRVNLSKKGVTLERVRNPHPDHVKTASVTYKVVAEATEVLRENANKVLNGQLTKLASKPVGKLANRGQGEAAVLETLSRTWRNLNGNPDSITFSFGASQQSSEPVIERAVVTDVTSTPLVADQPANTGD